MHFHQKSFDIIQFIGERSYESLSWRMRAKIQFSECDRRDWEKDYSDLSPERPVRRASVKSLENGDEA